MFDGGNSSSVWSGYGAPRVELPLVAGQAVPIGGWTMVCTIGINLILSYLSSMFDGGNSSGVWSGYGAPKLQEWNCHWWLHSAQAAPFGGWITQAADDLHQKAAAAFLHAAPKYPPPFSFSSLSPLSAVQSSVMLLQEDAMQFNKRITQYALPARIGNQFGVRSSY